MQQPILIIAGEDAAQTIATALHQEFGVAIELAPNRRAGLAALRRAEYSLVLLDEGLAMADAEAAHNLYEKALATPVLELNFAYANTQRALRQARAALVRRAHDQANARHAATLSLQNDLKSELTGLLLHSQLALREATPGNVTKLRQLVQMADNLRSRLSAHA